MNGANSNGVDDSGGWATSRRFLWLLGAAIFAAFPLVATGGRTLFSRDFGALGYPGAVFLRDCLFRGELPLWNPDSHCGVPFLAQMGTWYPPGWLALLLPLPWALNFSMLAHLFFGGAGMHRLARRWGLGELPAAFAAFAFVFNGVTLSCLLWGNYIASLAWLPWVVLAVTAAWRGGGRALAGAAVAGAMQVLTATPELTLLTWLFLGGLWLAEINSGAVKLWPSLGRLFAVVALAAGLTMVQMLPFYDLLRHSQRDPGSAEAAAWAMPGWGWANLIVPLFHCYRGPQGNWFQTGQEFLQSYYPGAVVLALGLAGALLARSRRTLALAGMILFCWVMALGHDGFFYDRLRAVFPLVGIARFPVKFAVLPAFLLPLLAAQGLERILQPESKRARRLFIAVVAGLAAFGAGLLLFLRAFPYPNDEWHATALNTLERGAILLAAAAVILGWNRAPSRAAKIILLLALPALLVADAFRHSPRLVPTLPAGVMAPGMWEAAGRPPVRVGQGRVMLSPAAEARLGYSDVADFQADFLGRRVAEWYNLNLLDGVPKVAGAFTLRPARFDFIERKLYHGAGPAPGEGLLDFLSVAWTTSPQNLLEWVARPNGLPVITAGQAPKFADDAATWSGIAAKDFDPRAEVYLLASQRPLVSVTNRVDATVANAKFANNRIAADVTASAPALVVLSQVNYHCWRAAVDGRPAPILTANLAFQALEVPAGTHHVELVYRDRQLVIGAVISLLSLAVCAGLWWRGGRVIALR
jgi:Bacterial membrane protein YfhO